MFVKQVRLAVQPHLNGFSKAIGRAVSIMHKQDSPHGKPVWDVPVGAIVQPPASNDETIERPAKRVRHM